MYSRISSALGLFVLLAACGAESPPPPGETVDCAIGAGAQFSPACTLERIAGTEEIVLHHPGGGFRRLTRDPVTGMLAARDGAEPLVLLPDEGGAVQFAVGEERYRIAAGLLESPAS